MQHDCMPGLKPKHGLQQWFPLLLHTVGQTSDWTTALRKNFNRWVGAWCLSVAEPTVAQLEAFFSSDYLWVVLVWCDCFYMVIDCSNWEVAMRALHFCASTTAESRAMILRSVKCIWVPRWLGLLSVFRRWFCFFIYCLMYFSLCVGVLCLSLFCYALFCVHSTFAIVLQR